MRAVAQRTRLAVESDHRRGGIPSPPERRPRMGELLREGHAGPIGWGPTRQMHEMAITQSVVTAIGERLPDADVIRVKLEIGKLSGVMADSVRFCFDVASAGTPLEGARLEIDEPAGKARCRDCGTVSDLPDLILLCDCGSADLEILAGTELLIKEVEVA